MQITTTEALRHQLEDRRQRLSRAVEKQGQEDDLLRLLQQVDTALNKLGGEEYGRCLVCREHVDEADLLLNPLAEYCLCRLTPEQQDALQSDLNLAWRIQSALLPDPEVRSDGWSLHYLYEPAGPVSGDYCDVWETTPGDVSFFVGDVSGKGVSASLLMAHLNAAFRSRVDSGLPLADLVSEASRLLLQSTIASHYATLACGRTGRDGVVEIVNAGHCPPLAVRAGGVEPVPSTGFPLGLMEERSYGSQRLRLDPGDSIVLYTDGLSEARNRDGAEYGDERIAALLGGLHGAPARELARACRADLTTFLEGGHQADDLTLMVVRRER